MDEVRTDRLMAKYGNDSLLVIIRDWPASEKYKDKPEMVASLEYLVCLVNVYLQCINTPCTNFFLCCRAINKVQFTFKNAGNN